MAVLQPSRPVLRVRREPVLRLQTAVSLGGLGGLLDKLQNVGQGETVKSWLGPDQNQPIEPGQLRSALGQKTVNDAAQQAGISDQDFLSQLAQALPQFVDKLTPNGRIPSLQEIASALSQK